MKMDERQVMTISDTMATLERALRGGHVIHAFRSGGGLRVVLIEKGRHGPLAGYGECPHISEALRQAAEDYPTGARGKLHSIPPAAATAPTSKLDAWVHAGRPFDARCEGDLFVVELSSAIDGVGTTARADRLSKAFGRAIRAVSAP
jgi:hypothetical protein